MFYYTLFNFFEGLGETKICFSGLDKDELKLPLSAVPSSIFKHLRSSIFVWNKKTWLVSTLIGEPGYGHISSSYQFFVGF